MEPHTHISIDKQTISHSLDFTSVLVRGRGAPYIYFA